jgi:lysophospholipase L1-like esterase
MRARRPSRLAATVAIVGLVGCAPAARARTIAYTALGDSYSAGLGTGASYTGEDGCGRSPLSYPAEVSAAKDLKLTFAACSGAKTGDVLNDQLGSLDSATRYVTISIGGNDVSFLGAVPRCATPSPLTCSSAIAAIEGSLRRTLPERLDSLYSAIRARANRARVIVVGYPWLFAQRACPSLTGIDVGEQMRLNRAIDLLDGAIQARANAHGFQFADPRPAFSAHEICSRTPWLNGLSTPSSEPLHPNAEGQRAYAALVERAMVG